MFALRRGENDVVSLDMLASYIHSDLKFLLNMSIWDKRTRTSFHHADLSGFPTEPLASSFGSNGRR